MTIKDIARLCGVSVSTVSRVLNDRSDVSEENRRRVLEVIESSNYIPNNTARDLVKTKSDAIAPDCLPRAFQAYQPAIQTLSRS